MAKIAVDACTAVQIFAVPSQAETPASKTTAVLPAQLNKSEKEEASSSGLAMCFEQGQRVRIMIQEKKGAADGTAGQQVTTFVFLKSERAAAED